MGINSDHQTAPTIGTARSPAQPRVHNPIATPDANANHASSANATASASNPSAVPAYDSTRMHATNNPQTVSNDNSNNIDREDEDEATAAATTATIWSGIIGTGQSLSTGVQGELLKQTAPADGGWMLSDSTGNYSIKDPRAASLSLVPLTEIMRPHDDVRSEYPYNLDGQTPQSAMAAQIAAMARQSLNAQYNTAHSTVGISGAPMFDIQKDGNKNAYNASLFEATALTRLVRERSKGVDISYDAVVLTHGETDSILTNHEYQDQLLKMQQDYALDLKHITGQSRMPVLILSQQQACPPAKDHISTVIQAQWRAQQLSSNKIICSGPKYQYGYATGDLHIPVAGYNRLGEKYGQVFYQTVVEGKNFIPLSPKALRRVDARTIKVTFHVPVPPLRWDENLPPRQADDHPSWTAGRGFEVRDSELKDVDIESVCIDDDGESVTIHLGCGTYSGPLSVSYAMTCASDAFTGGAPSGRMGQLCDSDPVVGAGAETSAWQVENSSDRVVYTGTPADFQRVALYDIVTPGEYNIVKIVSENPGTVQLDRPWEGSSGLQKLKTRHNHRNYLVSFFGRFLNPKEEEEGQSQFPVPLRLQ